MAKWGLSSWLVCVRLIQVLGTLISAALNGALLVTIHVQGLGLNQNMFALEIMACIVLIYTAIVLLVQHTGNQDWRARTGVVVAFMIGDVIFTGIVIGVISMLARAGVPANCGGFETDKMINISKKDHDDLNKDGYTTLGFSNHSGGAKGKLDKFCAMERGFYFIGVALIFSYMATLALTLQRIFHTNYTKNSEVDDRLARQEEMFRLEAKVTRNAHHNGGYSSLDQQARTPTLPMPTEGIIGSGSGSSNSPRSLTSRTLTVSSFPESQRQHQQQHINTIRNPHQPNNVNTRRSNMISTVSPASSSSPAIAFDPAREGLLIEQQEAADQAASDRAAEEALVTDGYRQQPVYGVPAPPYTPGTSSSHFLMDGHGAESNEMRLSGYVKGETRAQIMKDRGGGL